MAVNLIVDTPNILFRVASMNSNKYFETDEERAGLALHVAFQTINKYYRRFKPDRLIFAFEGPNNWRKQYTATDDCVSGHGYKANRVKDPSMEPFFELINSFHDVMRTHSAAVCIQCDYSEGDDVIAYCTEMLTDDGDEVIIISADKDFVQLYQYPNVRLIDPATDKDRDQIFREKNQKLISQGKKPDPIVNEDGSINIDWYIFEKSIRGDKGDNVFSAYPRVRTDKMWKAFTDEYKLVEFKNETWTRKSSQLNEDGEQQEEVMKVGDLMDENRLLTDLTMQPDYVRECLRETILEEFKNPGKYSHFHFLRFLGEYGLKDIAENINRYTDMLSCLHYTEERRSPAKKSHHSSTDKYTQDEDDADIIDRTKKGKETSESTDELLKF